MSSIKMKLIFLMVCSISMASEVIQNELTEESQIKNITMTLENVCKGPPPPLTDEGLSTLENQIIEGLNLTNLNDSLRTELRQKRSKDDKDEEVKQKENIWKHGKVYYLISHEFRESEARTILLAMKHIALRTKCIRFYPYTGKQKDYVVVERGNDGCRANIGCAGGMQLLLLEVPICVSSDPRTAHNVVHEFGHILGLHHEHTRGDRDKYITIVWDNIEKGEEINFQKEKNYVPKVAYSYTSIMHYSAFAFSPSGKPSMLAKKKTNLMGSQGIFNKYDVMKVRSMYKCKGTKANASKAESDESKSKSK